MNFLNYILREFIYFYNEIAIYLVFGFVVAGILYVLFPTSMVKKHLGNDTFASVIKSSLFGIPLPLCSCGVVPVATSLKNNGASRGATVSFLISTPQVGADSFLITYSLLGWVFALFRVIASIITAMFAGIAVNITRMRQQIEKIRQKETEPLSSAKSRLRNVAEYVEFELLGSIANSLVVGMIVAAGIAVIIPDDFFLKYLNSNLLSMLLMLIAGIPMYVCASASTPIAASLIMKGLSPGAGLVFLLTGPATNAVTISAVVKVLGKKAVVIYLVSIAAVAVGLGYLLNVIAARYGFGEIITTHQHQLLPSWLKVFGSLLLTAMLLLYYGMKLKKRFFKMQDNKQRSGYEFSVDGMTCRHCVRTVKNAVESVDGTKNVQVDLESHKVYLDVDSDSVIENVKTRVKDAGYTV
jgi:uncharacterized protein